MGKWQEMNDKKRMKQLNEIYNRLSDIGLEIAIVNDAYHVLDLLLSDGGHKRFKQYPLLLVKNWKGQ